MQSPLSVVETLKGRHIFFTGASGFLGKVWLAMMLDRVPEVGRIYVLIRGKANQSARARFERMVNESYAFASLHEKHGAALSAFLSARVEVVDGQLSSPSFGLETEVAARIQRRLDVLVHCAGQVDFDPEVDDALVTNVDGTLNAAEFASRARGCRFVQVSTCFVAGNRDGRIREEAIANYAPARDDFDVESEYHYLHRLIADTREETVGEAALDKMRGEIVQTIAEKGHDPNNAQLVERILRRESRAALSDRLVQVGKERAQYWGWQNVYTFTKSMAESLLLLRYPDMPKTIFRPAITESAQAFPLQGWNEGLNTSGPLIYFMGTWFRHMPGKNTKPLDIIPVDQCCASLIAATAALLADRHRPVYQAATSDVNPINVKRALDLTALAHRKHLRKHGATAAERVILSRWDGRGVEGDHILSVENLRTLVRAVGDAARKPPTGFGEGLQKQAKKLASRADRAERRLNLAERVFETYRPFTTANPRQVFEAKSLSELETLEPEFRFQVQSLDWRRYWIDAHVPGLRRWSFPIIENKRVEQYSPRTPFQLLSSTLASAVQRDTRASVIEDSQAPEVAE